MNKSFQKSQDKSWPKTPLGKVILGNLGILLLFLMWERLNTGIIWLAVASGLCLVAQGLANLVLGLLLLLGDPYKQVGKAMARVGLIMVAIGIVLVLSFLRRSH